jgi:asparagine synthase (glutamine-hydrolysing)
MAVSLETRLPFLDCHVAEVAARIPAEMKFERGRGKLILRKLLARKLPQPVVDRPKQGFGIPLGAWLRDPLRDWAETLLEERRLGSDGFFDPGVVRKTWQQHLQGTRDASSALWPIRMFQAWRESAAEFKRPGAAARTDPL